jgi:hypothetical protein
MRAFKSPSWRSASATIFSLQFRLTDNQGGFLLGILFHLVNDALGG